MRTYLLVMMIAAAVTFLATPIARHLARYLKAVNPVRQRDVHTVPIPRLGGLAMFGGFVVALIAASRIPFLTPAFTDTNQAVGVVAAAAWVVLLGVADDKWDLDWWAKLGGQIFAGLILALTGTLLVTFPIAGLTIGSSRFSIVTTVLVVVAIINAINWIDGLDGLASGVVAIGASAFFLYSYLLTRVSSPENYASLASALTAVLVGICIGFLPHNVHPARIFMGDTGSMLLGLVFSAAAILVTGNIDPARVGASQAWPAFLPIALPVLVLFLPILDMAMSVGRRLRNGQSPFYPDRMHLHHRLLDRMHSHSGAVAIMWLWTFVISFSAALAAAFPWRIVAVWAAIGIVIAAALTWATTHRTKEIHDAAH